MEKTIRDYAMQAQVLAQVYNKPAMQELAEVMTVLEKHQSAIMTLMLKDFLEEKGVSVSVSLSMSFDREEDVLYLKARKEDREKLVDILGEPTHDGSYQVEWEHQGVTIRYNN